MLVRNLTLLAVPVLTALLAPREASACSPSTGFEIERAYPAADATEVPIDGVIVVAGTGWSATEVLMVVKRGDTEVEGSIEMPDFDHYVWRSTAPLLPHTTYSLHFEANDEQFPDAIDHSFTTGPVSAPNPGPALLASASAEAFDLDIKECVEDEGNGDCGGCQEWKVVDVEHRMRLVASIAAPEGPFVGYYSGRVSYGPSADALGPAVQRFQADGGGDIVHTIDLGIAGSWPSDEVCVHVEVGDPLGTFAQGQVSCVDVSEINVEVEDPTTGDTADTGDTDDGATTSAGTDDGLDTDDLPENDSEYEGCGCRGGDRSAWPGALLLLAVGLLRPGRRRR